MSLVHMRSGRWLWRLACSFFLSHTSLPVHLKGQNYKGGLTSEKWTWQLHFSTLTFGSLAKRWLCTSLGPSEQRMGRTLWRWSTLSFQSFFKHSSVDHVSHRVCGAQMIGALFFSGAQCGGWGIASEESRLFGPWTQRRSTAARAWKL